jgi:hypothetical protein
LEFIEPGAGYSALAGPEFGLSQEKARFEFEDGVTGMIGLIAKSIRIAFRVG